jgi:surface carbohydrate biosynthesis protein
MTSPRILLLVPYAARDFDGAALVGHHLRARHGVETLFTNGYGIERKLLRLSPDALVLDHLVWDFKAAEARLAKRLGMKVFLLPTEGLYHDPGPVRQAMGEDHGVSDAIDAAFCWGGYMRRAVEGLLPAERAPETGCPRFDFYAPRWRGLLPPRGAFLRSLGFERPEAPLLLWCTNTPYFARDRKEVVRRYVSRSNMTEREVLDFLEDEAEQFREHSGIVLELARRRPEWNVCVKIHPAEWAEPYRDFPSRPGNVRVAHAQPIRDFLHHADVLLQRNCTTATEAWMLGKHVLDLDAGVYRRVARNEFREGCTPVADADAAEAAVLRALGGEPVPEGQRRAREAFLSEFYGAIDGRAAERCAAQIAAELSAEAYPAARRARKDAEVARERRMREELEDRRLVNRMKDFCGIRRETSLRFWRRIRSAREPATTEVEITPGMVEGAYARIGEVAT